VKHGRHTLRRNPLTAEQREHLMRDARTVIEQWPTRRDNADVILANCTRKEDIAEARKLAKAARRESKEETKNERNEMVTAALVEAATVGIEGIECVDSSTDSSDSSSSSDEDDDASDEDGERAARAMEQATRPRISASGRSIRRKFL
jgi:hypothetical protein